MGDMGGFWNQAQDLLDEDEPEGQESTLPSDESNNESFASVGTNAITYRSRIGSPGVVVAVVFVGFLLLSSVVAFLLWSTSRGFSTVSLSAFNI